MTHIVGHLLPTYHLNKKLIKFVLISFTMFLLFSCVGCEKANTNDEKVITTETAISLLGMEKEELFDTFDGLLEERSENPDILELSSKMKYNENAVGIAFELLNGRLFRIQYNFGEEADDAFSFALESYSKIISKYGESDTYESLPNRIEGLDVNLYLSDNIYERKEYWIGTDVDFAEIVPKEYENSKRVDLGIGINKIPADKTITMVYIGGIINSINTTKLPN